MELTKGEDAAILDTQARVYATQGDFTKAIQIQTKAVEKASDERLKGRLAGHWKSTKCARKRCRG